MEINYLEEAIACLGEERRVLHYFEEQYAFYLLQRQFVDLSEVRIDQLRTGQFAKLLNKTNIKQLVSTCGNGRLTKEKLDQFYPLNYESYVVTLSKWGSKENYSWS